jgi:mannose-1-phosphate guanylyltransferase
MKGMVLAAGFGTRFRPATYEIPKPMVPVCNRPLIGWAVESLLRAGIREIIVNLHHLPDQIESYLRVQYAGRCTFIFSYEEEILGTGGGVRRVRETLESEDAFLLINGDTIQQPPFDELLGALRERNAIASLLLRHPPPDDRFTPVMFDGSVVTGFGNGGGEALMFAGAHALSRKIFGLLPDRDFSGLTEDVYIPLSRNGAGKIVGIVHDGLWFDIGTPRRYLTASLEVLQAMIDGVWQAPEESRLGPRGSILGRDSRAEGELMRAVLGNETVTHAGSVIENSVLWDRVDVGERAVIRESVIGHGIHLPAASMIGNVLLCRALEGVEYENGIQRWGDLAGRAIDAQRPALVELSGS